MVCKDKNVQSFKFVRWVLFIFSLFAFFLGSSFAATYDIEDESVYSSQSISTNEYVQSIIKNNASSGDTIKFHGSSYNNISLVVDKKLNIVSASITNFVGSNNNGITVTGLNASGTNISGFNFSFYANGIMLNCTSDVTVSNLVLDRNYYGIFVSDSSSIIIKNSYFFNNTDPNPKGGGRLFAFYDDYPVNEGAGVFVKNVTNILINNSRFDYNFDGVYVNKVENFTFTLNIVEHSTWRGLAISHNTASNVLVFNNTFRHGAGIFLNCYLPNLTIVKNYFLDMQPVSAGSPIFMGLQIIYPLGNIIKDNICYNTNHLEARGAGVTVPLGDNLGGGFDCGIIIPQIYMIILRTGPTTYTAYLIGESSNKIATNLPAGDIIFKIGGKTFATVPMVNGYASIEFSIMDLTADISASFFSVGASIHWNDPISEFLANFDDVFQINDWNSIPEFIPGGDGTGDGNGSGSGGSGSGDGNGSGSGYGNGDGDGFGNFDFGEGQGYALFNINSDVLGGFESLAKYFTGSADYQSFESLSDSNSDSIGATENKIPQAKAGSISTGGGSNSNAGQNSGLKSSAKAESQVSEVSIIDDNNDQIASNSLLTYIIMIFILLAVVIGYYTQRKRFKM